jgi:hypothetical protein
MAEERSRICAVTIITGDEHDTTRAELTAGPPPPGVALHEGVECERRTR